MRLSVQALLGLALLLVPARAWAQSDPGKEDEAWQFFFFEEVLQRSCDDPTLESAIALPQPKLILEATDDGKTKVKARVGVEIKKKLVANLEVESPRSSSGETTLASLDGLSDGGSAELALSWFHAPWDRYKAVVKIKEHPQDSEAAGTKWRIEDYANPPVSRPSAIAAFGPKRSKEAVEEYQKWMKDNGRHVPVLTIRAKAEQKEFRFFTPSAGPPAGLRKTFESHTNYQFTASAGAYLWGSAYSAVNYRRGTQYEDGATQEFCSPSGAARILDCTNLVVAPPNKGKPEALEFELRGLFGSIGLAAHVTRDLQANVTVVDLPVYLLQKLGTSEMELNLGARVQWRSDTEDFALSVFIGPALSTVLRMGNGGTG